jgi:hypothetical protein
LQKPWRNFGKLAAENKGNKETNEAQKAKAIDPVSGTSNEPAATLP